MVRLVAVVPSALPHGDAEAIHTRPKAIPHETRVSHVEDPRNAPGLGIPCNGMGLTVALDSVYHGAAWGLPLLGTRYTTERHGVYHCSGLGIPSSGMGSTIAWDWARQAWQGAMDSCGCLMECRPWDGALRGMTLGIPRMERGIHTETLREDRGWGTESPWRPRGLARIHRGKPWHGGMQARHRSQGMDGMAGAKPGHGSGEATVWRWGNV
jgi:hypothetical protein